MVGNTYNNGYIQRMQGGKYEGSINIEGVDLSPIEAVLFKRDGNTHLWLRRKPILEYDETQQKYIPRLRRPQWEAYLTKQCSDTVAYRGECMFFKFKFIVTGIWDQVLGLDKTRLNLFIERAPDTQQVIINKTRDVKQKRARDI